MSEALAEIEKSAELRVLDVRTKREYEEGHLPGAININIADQNFPEMLQRFDTDAPILVYCRSGRRSKLAVRILETMGFSRILHMKDGWIGWEKLRLPVDRESH
ncbi:MAG: rhodanese-like domain-containing protein [Desulfovibrio sp.]|nr:rhodanese-like domain-containing protein [Desulfovibrio sp.]